MSMSKLESRNDSKEELKNLMNESPKSLQHVVIIKSLDEFVRIVNANLEESFDEECSSIM